MCNLRLKIVRFTHNILVWILCHMTQSTWCMCRIGKENSSACYSNARNLQSYITHASWPVQPVTVLNISYAQQACCCRGMLFAASLEPLCHEDPACKSLFAPPVTGSHSTSGTACWQATTRRDEPLDQKVLTRWLFFAVKRSLYSCKVTLLYLYFFPRNLSLRLLDLLGESFCLFKSIQHWLKGWLLFSCTGHKK